jgi:hypothetical protein
MVFFGHVWHQGGGGERRSRPKIGCAYQQHLSFTAFVSHVIRLISLP